MSSLSQSQVQSLKSALRDAVMNNNIETINKLLTQYNFELNFPIDLNGLSLLHFAVQNGREKIVEFLCTKMNDTNVTDNLGRTPLHYAASKSDTSILKTLIAAGANVNSQTIGGETPLMKTIIFSKTLNAKILLRFGADPLICNQAGLNSKDLAMNNRNVEIVSLISHYEEIFYKLSLLVYTYINLQNTQRANPLHKLSPNMIKQLTRFIIP